MYKLTQKKGKLHRHAGPLYLKDLNGCNDARECSSSGTPIPLRLTSRTNAFRNAPALTHGSNSSPFFCCLIRSEYFLSGYHSYL